MPFESAVERTPRKAEGLGRIAHIASRACKRLLNQHALDVFKAHLVKCAGAVSPPAAAQPEVSGPHSTALRHQHRPLDRVIELPHIAGPRMPEQ